MLNKILIIDDDKSICRMLKKLIEPDGHHIDCAYTGKSGIKKLEAGAYELVLLDLRLPDSNGLDLLPEIKKNRSSAEVIILTGNADHSSAALSITMGAWDYIQKPFSTKELKIIINRAITYQNKKRYNDFSWLDRKHIIGESRKMKQTLNLVAQSAQSDLNVLVSGETGTGKELIALTIHENSERKDNDFIVLDCSILTESLIESTLFGHKKGSFTGAVQNRIGVVEQAHQGTLFMDEVAELPLSSQKAFLRILQEKSYRPLGQSKRKQVIFD